MQSSAILKYTQRRMMLIMQSALLISIVKSGSLSHKTKLIKTEEFKQILKVIFFFLFSSCEVFLQKWNI